MLCDKSSYLVSCSFRLVFYRLEVLRRSLPTGVQEALDQLPRTLDETYARILNQILEANQAPTYRMLQCLTVAVRPLRVEELAEMLAFDFDTTKGAVPRYCPDWRPNDPEDAVLSTCSSLITIVDHAGSHVVQFSHFSVKEFLISNYHKSSLGDLSRYQIFPGAAHTILAQICLGFLLYLGDHMDDKSVKGLPLVQYAAEHWVTHAQFEDVASRVKDGMVSLLDPDKPHFAAWVEICNIDQPSQTYREISSEIPTPLYFSSLCGFSELVEHLSIKHLEHVNTMGGRYKFPLLAALVGKHVRAAEILLQRGASVNVRGMRERTPLHEAITYASLVQLLLNSGADVNCQQDDLRTPLHLASYYGKLEVARILLEHKADVNSLDDKGKNPLHLLDENPYSNEDDVLDLAKLLLKHGADVKRRDKDNNTPLHLTINARMYKSARMLLEHGADATVENNKGATPLHLLFGNRSANKDDILDLTRLLLEHGADVNRRDEDNNTPLHLAIDAWMYKSARMLLEHGANATVENNKGATALHLLFAHRVTYRDDILDLTRLLLEHGADVNRRDKDNNTPLHLAIDAWMYKSTRILLEHGADATVENNKGATPLHLLFAHRVTYKDDILDLTRLLLEHGADVNRRDKDNNTPLHLAIDAWMYKSAKILLEHGADATVETDKGATPLHLLFAHRISYKDDILDLTRLLLEHGADVNRRDKDNNTPLHLAIDAWMYKSAKILLEHGADATVENNKGATPLHLLFAHRISYKDDILDLTRLLLEHGADVNRRDKDNNTPLHLAIDAWMYESAKILLEQGANATVENDVGNTPLHLLFKYSNSNEADLLDVTRLLLERGADVNARAKNGSTPLHVSVDNGSPEAIRFLLEHGAHVNVNNNEGKTPLHLARTLRRTPIEKVLLDNGAEAHPYTD
jgi:ankyrin repeat protein